MSTAHPRGRRPGSARTTLESSFPHVLASAVHRRGVSLRWLQRRLAESGHSVGLSTLSQWQNGHRRPEGAASLAAVEELEQVLSLRSGSLTSGLGPARRVPPSKGVATQADFDRTGDVMVDVLGELDFELPFDLAEESIHTTVQLDARYGLTIHSVRTVLRATFDGARRFPFGLRIDDPQSRPVDLRPLAGCALGRSVLRPQEGLFAWELVLERPLRVNETTVVEHEVTLSPTSKDPDRFYEHHVLRRVAELLVLVKFTPGHVPDACQLVERALAGDEITTVVDMTGTTSVHHRARNFGPGEIGVHWDHRPPSERPGGV